MLKLYYGKVIKNDSTQKNSNSPKNSQIQVRIIPELKDIKDESLLPWVRPFTGIGMNNTNFSHNPPEVNDNVWVFFMDEPYWREGFYIPGRIIDGLFDYSKWENIKGNMPELSATTYPQPHFWLMNDGSIFFVNTDTNDKGIYNNSNDTYVLITGSGQVAINTGSEKVTINSDQVIINSGSRNAARQDDATLIDATTDSSFITWMATVSAVINALIPGSVPSIPTSVTGKVNDGTDKLKLP